jgi:hypothetical protein
MLSQIVEEVLELCGARSEAVGVFLFGSALSVAQPHDVDLLYVYRPELGAVQRAINVRRAMYGPVKSALDLEPHIMLLNEREVAQTNFIQEERCVLVWSHEPRCAAG